jgi:hypothetical protein
MAEPAKDADRTANTKHLALGPTISSLDLVDFLAGYWLTEKKDRFAGMLDDLLLGLAQCVHGIPFSVVRPQRPNHAIRCLALTCTFIHGRILTQCESNCCFF